MSKYAPLLFFGYRFLDVTSTELSNETATKAGLQFKPDWWDHLWMERVHQIPGPTTKDLFDPAWTAFMDQRDKLVIGEDCRIFSSGSIQDSTYGFNVGIKMRPVEEPQPVSDCRYSPRDENDLRKFCEIMGIPWKNPAWQVANNVNPYLMCLPLARG